MGRATMGNDGRCPILQHRHLESAGGFHNILAAKLPLALAPVHTCVAALPLALLVRPRLPRDHAALARFHALPRLAHGRYVFVLLVCLLARSSTRARASNTQTWFIALYDDHWFRYIICMAVLAAFFIAFMAMDMLMNGNASLQNV